MKSILIIGMSRFGQNLCKNLSELGNQIMIVDRDEDKLEPMLDYVLSAKVGDCTNEEVLKSLGVSNFDLVFVCIGTDFQSSLETTSLLNSLGAKHIISKARKDIQAKFLLRNGADEVIDPDKDMAKRAAVKYSAKSVFDFMKLTDDLSLCEILPLPEWVGKTLHELDLRKTLGITVLGSKTQNKTRFALSADHCIEKDEHLIIVGEWSKVSKLIDKLENIYKL